MKSFFFLYFSLSRANEAAQRSSLFKVVVDRPPDGNLYFEGNQVK